MASYDISLLATLLCQLHNLFNCLQSPNLAMSVSCRYTLCALFQLLINFQPPKRILHHSNLMALRPFNHPAVLLSAPFASASWHDPDILQRIHVPEIEERLKRITGAKTVITETLLKRGAPRERTIHSRCQYRPWSKTI